MNPAIITQRLAFFAHVRYHSNALLRWYQAHATVVLLAGVAKLADAYGSGPYEGNFMKVQVLSPAPLLLAPLVLFLRIVPRIAYARK